MSDGKTGLQLRSLLKKSGELELSLVNVQAGCNCVRCSRRAANSNCRW